jgi:hypothetical protein
MRVPFTPLHHSFPEFEALTRAECDRYIAYARTTQPWLVGVWPFVIAVLAGITVIVVPAMTGQLGSSGVNFLMAGLGAIGAFVFVWMLLRDVLLWWFVRGQVLRARCPKCKYSLQGLPIIEIGDGLDPTMRFVRCVECGRKHRLFDLGITPMDLVPFEMRGVPEDFGRVLVDRRDQHEC